MSDYDIQYRRVGAETWTWHQRNTNSVQPRADIGGLSQGVEYEVQVRAKNSVDPGPWASAKRRTLDVPAAPARPNVRATPDSRTSLDVSWRAPDDGGSAIRSYLLQFRTAAVGSTPGRVVALFEYRR